LFGDLVTTQHRLNIANHTVTTIRAYGMFGMSHQAMSPRDMTPPASTPKATDTIDAQHHREPKIERRDSIMSNFASPRTTVAASTKS
jgi:hypothetical protein